MSVSNRTARTPSPKQRSLIVTVDEEGTLANLTDGILPPEGTPFGDKLWKGIFPGDYYKKFKNFRYLQQLEDSKAGAQLLFARMMTDKERDTPFRTTTRFGNHYWHTILLELKPVQVKGFPLSTSVGSGNANVNAARYVMRERYIPAATEGSRFQIDEFISDVPFKIPKSPVPIAAAVSYDFINRRGGFPECIHDKLVIPAVTTVAGQRLAKQVFLETNFTTWSSYIISDEQELTQNVYYRKRIRVFPPAFPDEQLRIA